MTKNKNHLKQPRVLQLAFITSMCERFGFYALSFLLVLFVKSAYHLGDAQAFALFGVFTGLAFVTPAVGGYLADNFFGIRRSMIIGLIGEGLGLTCLAIPNQALFPVGLALIIVGEGLFKTGPTNLMARAYAEKDPRIDSGFTLFYMAMNLGAATAPILTALLQKFYGWHIAFLSGAISLYLGVISYFLFHHTAHKCDSPPGEKKLPATMWSQLIIGTIASCAIFAFLMQHLTIANIFFIVATSLIVVYFLFEIIKSPKEEKFKIIACLALILMGLAFFVFYFQAFTSMTLFIKRSVVRNIFNIHVSTVMFLSLNPFWILVLSPILATLYNYLGKKGKDLAVTTKFPLGIFIVSLCFLTLVLSAHFANIAGKVSPLWIVIAFLLYSFGELLTSALGVAMVTHIAPQRMYGVMMGAWFLIAAALGASLSGKFAGLANIPDTMHDPHMILHIYSSAFLKLGIGGIVVALIAFAISPYIKRIAKLN